MPMNTLTVPMSDRPPAGPDRGERQPAATGRSGRVGRALVMAGLLLPASVCIAPAAAQPAAGQASTLHDRVGQGSGMGKSLQLLHLLLAENQRRHRTTKRQGAPQVTPQILDDICGTAH